MGNYRLVGWAEYDAFLLHLDRLGIKFLERKSEWRDPGLATPDERRILREQGLEPARLRRASFVNPITRTEVFLEEYIRWYRRSDLQPTVVVIETVQYRAGERPPLHLWAESVWT